ncbi:hypothetical protein G3545_02420 [Starkeya sp. ORNL1]|uniref:hypothetical protein n=1 Tax=Starkeya sp. ORNL1 TaxID=2709380 RepID=UPI00146498D0|nr:hypothetical protein [Starkeya sp. ORNL1]QJP12617.1 hypothetical protein G3545_02420 [Starkeya sp. ORNL1]
MTHSWRSITHLQLKLDDEGISEEFWLKNGDQQAIGFYCDLGLPSADGDDDLPPTAGWYDTNGQPLGFTPAQYRPLDHRADEEG